MAHRRCPFWMGYFLLSPLRRVGQNPDRILTPFVGNGMTVLEIGPGMGFFTLPLARMVGQDGKIVCVDTEEKMVAGVRRRAAKAGLGDRVESRNCLPTALGIDDLAGKVDFVLLFAVAHEVPDVSLLFDEIARAMKPDARCLLAEPRFHVSEQEFSETLAAARYRGLRPVDLPRIRSSRAALLVFSQP